MKSQIQLLLRTNTQSPFIYVILLDSVCQKFVCRVHPCGVVVFSCDATVTFKLSPLASSLTEKCTSPSYQCLAYSKQDVSWSFLTAFFYSVMAAFHLTYNNKDFIGYERSKQQLTISYPVTLTKEKTIKILTG